MCYQMGQWQMTVCTDHSRVRGLSDYHDWTAQVERGSVLLGGREADDRSQNHSQSEQKRVAGLTEAARVQQLRAALLCSNVEMRIM